MRVFTRLLAAAVLASAVSGCATMIRGTTTPFTVESTPPGAKVKTSTGFTCPATPCTFKMPRKDRFEITVAKDGFKTVTTNVESHVAGAGAAGLAGNVIAGGIVGMGVDAASGAMNDLTPNPLRLALEPETPAAEPAP